MEGRLRLVGGATRVVELRLRHLHQRVQRARMAYARCECGRVWLPLRREGGGTMREVLSIIFEW